VLCPLHILRRKFRTYPISFLHVARYGCGARPHERVVYGVTLLGVKQHQLTAQQRGECRLMDGAVLVIVRGLDEVEVVLIIHLPVMGATLHDTHHFFVAMECVDFVLAAHHEHKLTDARQFVRRSVVWQG